MQNDQGVEMREWVPESVREGLLEEVRESIKFAMMKKRPPNIVKFPFNVKLKKRVLEAARSVRKRLRDLINEK